jgi:hypothetical protein
MDEVSGDGSAELLDDDTIEIEFAYHQGDEAVLKAKRGTSSNSLLDLSPATAQTCERPVGRRSGVPI